MVFVALEDSYPKPKPRSDGWTPLWQHWFSARRRDCDPTDRAPAVIHAVRGALRELGSIERTVVELYFYDGLSWGRIGDRLGLPAGSVRVIHRRALSILERLLTPFVRDAFGLDPARHPECPICVAPWRLVAEEILDGKTTDMSWGEIGRRLERAVGWRPSTPQIPITHQRDHRAFRPVVGPEESFNALLTESEEEP